MRKILILSVFLAVPMIGPLACSGDNGSSGDGDDGGDGDAGDGDTGDGDGDVGDGDGDGDDSLGGGSGDGDGDGNTPAVIVSEPSDPDCNLAGVWAIVTKTRTTAASMDQVANRWYLYAVSQQGDSIEVVDSVSCHVRVEDADELVSTVVTISDDALRAIVQRESHRGLSGTFTKNGDSCDLDFDRQYLVLGLPNSYLPADPLARPELDELPALPTEQDPEGAEDWDMDGQLGIGFAVQSLASGTRNSVQRSYNEYESSSPNYTIGLSSSEFTVNNVTSISESVIHATSSFLRTTGTLTGSDHPVQFTKLGDSFETAELPSGAPLPSSSFALCKALEEEFPFSL
jgi:hypothetical protein